MDLTRLALTARDGDRRALESFVRAVQPDVWRLCAHLTSVAEADDVAQESLLRIVSHLPRWERGPITSWAFGVTRNVCLEHRRSRRRWTTRAELLERAPASTPDPFLRVEIEEMLARLPFDQREALVLTQIIGLSYVDAAEVVGCAIGTIRSRVARARGALVETMEVPEASRGER